MDQMRVYFQATTTQVWARRGQTPSVRVATQRDYQHFYGAWYTMWMWIEHGFKDAKRGGFHWEQTKMTDPRRATPL